jgi:two-component system NtrC family response regulator
MRSTPMNGGGAGRTRVAPETLVGVDLGPVALVRELAECAAKADCPVLITGETGVGKGLLARWIHGCSRRAAQPFVPVNGAALPESLIDSQLFGHARGAFSGAASDHPGMVRAANTGTLFLDEVGDLPLSVQARLLRLLQEREVQPVGYCAPQFVDVRVIAATNASLAHAVAGGRFRQDLLYRLDVVRIEIPPLRECADQIMPLAEQFNDEFSGSYDKPRLEFERGAQVLLRAARWPGNVRELRAVVERLHLFAKSPRVSAETVRQIGRVEAAGGSVVTAPAAISMARLDATRTALTASGGRVSRAADCLGVHRSTVYRWLASESRGRRGAE